MDDQEYLEPNFDPSSLTVPRLRSILVAHNINYPSSAKKSQLIDLFNEHVVPQARRLRAANARVKRTSRGIVDVPSASQEAYDDDEDVEEEVPVTRSGGRRTTRARTEEAQEVMPTPRSGRHSTAPPESAPRRVPSKGRVSDAPAVVVQQDVKRPVSRKSRLSAQTPVAKVRLADEEDESPFSSENVFQSGSSPPLAPVGGDDQRRRTTSGSAVRDTDRRRSKERRRVTEEVKPARLQSDGFAAVPSSRKNLDPPVSVLKKRSSDIKPTAEFTPAEQMNLELVQAQQEGDNQQLIPARSRRTGTASKTARTGFSAIFVAILGGLATLYSQEKFRIGYCGDGSEGAPSREIAGVQIPEWADVLRPQCEPCPPHAVCWPGMQTTCEPDFNLVQSPLSMGGVLPVPPMCKPDTVKAMKVERVKERAIQELRDHNARFECGESGVLPSVRESELKARVSSKRLSRMGDREFEELWASAIGEVRGAEEVVEGWNGSSGSSGDLTLRSTSLARLPISCAIRRSLRQTLRQHLRPLITVFSLLSLAAYARYYITSTRTTETKARALAALALDRLSEQAALHAAEPGVYGEGFLSVAQLRDDVLRREWSTWNRRKLWDEVARKVERNSNVRPMVREGRSGDVGRVWEWVGASSPPMVSGGGGRRRTQGRVSFAGDFGEDDERDGMSEIRKWDGGGGQYY